MKKLSDVFPVTDGIFVNMAAIQGSNLPWKAKSIDTYLDTEYSLLRSGDKAISPLVDKLLSDDGTMTEPNKLIIATTIYQRFIQKWTKLYNTLSLTYNPIENYSMTETHTGTETRTNTPSNRKETTTQSSEDWKLTESQTPSEDYSVKVTQTPTDWTTTESADGDENTTSTEHEVSAFNSGYEDGTKDTTTTNRKVETTQSGTYDTETTQTGSIDVERTQTGTLTTEHTIEGTDEDETLYNTTLTRSGNIGVTTSQQMLQSEREVWLWDYFEIVFSDIDKMLTIPIYI